MKRSPIRRTGFRKQQYAAEKVARQRRLRRKPMKREPSEKQQAHVDVMQQKADQWRMAGAHCTLRSDGGCWGRLALHHRFTVARGGSDEDANLIWCCIAHHANIHDHPEESLKHGLLLRAEPSKRWEASDG